MVQEFYTKEEKQNNIELWESSGMTRKGYAASNGINEGTFYKWLERNHRQEGFVEIKQTRIVFEEKIIIRKCGMEIEVSPSAFEKVVKVLAAIGNSTSQTPGFSYVQGLRTSGRLRQDWAAWSAMR